MGTVTLGMPHPPILAHESSGGEEGKRLKDLKLISRRDKAGLFHSTFSLPSTQSFKNRKNNPIFPFLLVTQKFEKQGAKD